MFAKGSKMKRDLYFSLDVETDGPIPGPHSMRQVGLAAFFLTGTPEWKDVEGKGISPLLAHFGRNLLPLPAASPHPDTLKWWTEENPDIWTRIQMNAVSPDMGMYALVGWVDQMCKNFDARPVCVAYPATFDFMFLYWYLIKFMGASPFGFQGLDMKTLAMVKMKTSFRNVSKRTMPKEWFGQEKHTHDAVDDAIEQGWMFCRMMKS